MAQRGSSPAESQNGVLTLTSPPNPPIFLLDLSGNLMPGQLGQNLASTQLPVACLSAPGAMLVCSLQWTSLLSTGDVAFMWDLSPIPSSSGLMPHVLSLYAVTFKILCDGD